MGIEILNSAVKQYPNAIRFSDDFADAFRYLEGKTILVKGASTERIFLEKAGIKCKIFDIEQIGFNMKLEALYAGVNMA